MMLRGSGSDGPGDSSESNMMLYRRMVDFTLKHDDVCCNNSAPPAIVVADEKGRVPTTARGRQVPSPTPHLPSTAPRHPS